MSIRTKVGSWLMGPELKKLGDALPFVARWLSGKAQWNDWSTDKAIRDGLKASVWVYRCVNRRAKAAASVPWYVEERKGDKWERIPNHPIEVLLTEPNPFMTGQKLIEYLVNHLDLGGNGIWHIVMARDMPVEFWPIVPDPSLIKPVPDRQNFLSHYEYTLEAGDKRRLEPQEVIHFKFVDPSNFYWGLSPLQVAARVVDTDVEAVRWNKISLQNRAVTDGVFSFDSVLTEAQWKDARKMVREQHQGADNARTPWVLGGGAKWNSMSLSPVEMDFLNSRKFSREEICAVFDVPPILVGAMESSSYNNYGNARKAFWEDAIVPLLDDIRECLDMALVPFWDPQAKEPGRQANIRIMYDLSNVPAMQTNLNDRITAARTLWQMNVPFNDINQRLELGFDEVTGGDVPRSQSQNSMLGLASSSGPKRRKSATQWSEEQKAMFWKSRDADRQSWEERVNKQVAKRFQDEAKEIASAYEKGGKLEAQAAIEDQGDEWETLLTSVYTAVIEHFGQIEGERLGNHKGITGPKRRKFVFDPFEELVQQFVTRQTAKKITGILSTTRTLINQQIDQGIEDGESTGQIASRIHKIYKYWADPSDSEIDVSRAMLIARTETGQAAGYGNWAGAKQAEEEFDVEIEKEWISSRDDRVRSSHEDMDGERRLLDEPFSNGLMHPGDAEGDADEVIACRCVEAHHVLS